MSLIDLIDRLPFGAGPKVLAFVNGNAELRRLVSARIINSYAYAAPPRPRAISMHAPYTTWPGLTDRRWSGRHLPVAPAPEPALPDVEALIPLFERKTFIPSQDTSLLFAYFAQWFTDGFLRTKWEPDEPRLFRENESNHDIDLNQIYGRSETQTSMLRDPADRAMLRTQILEDETWPGPLFGETPEGGMALLPDFKGSGSGEDGLYSAVNFHRVFESAGRAWSDAQRRFAFAAGLEHGNSTIAQSAMNTLFVREHNRTAGILREAHADWDDEQVFQTARNTTIAVLLKIVIGDYIPHIAPVRIMLEAQPGMAEKERWYRTNWIPVEFALLYRWHELIPDAFELGGEHLAAHHMRRANERLVKNGLKRSLIEAARTPAGRIGLQNTTHFLLSKEGADVKRLSIDMARACALPSFNAYRRHFGLTPYDSFEALTGENRIAAELRSLYGSIDRLEWFVGLFAEKHGPKDMMGELMMTMVAYDAFTQALTNPLLSKSVYGSGAFGREGLRIVEETKTLKDVIVRNTDGQDAPLAFEL